MTSQFKVFHFQELDWLLYFPSEGNCGKYVGYSVLFVDRKGIEPKKSSKVPLGSLVECQELDEHYPHTVGFFKSHSCHNSAECEFKYMEIRIIHNLDEFWLFLNSLNI